MQISINCALLTMTIVLVACSSSDKLVTDQAPEPSMDADTVYINGKIYTVNEASVAQRLIDRGVDGLFTDYPDGRLTRPSEQQQGPFGD